MEFNKYDMYAYQIIEYLVSKHKYQIIRVQQHKEDIWLINAEHAKFPVIRISSKSNDTALNDGDYIRNAHRSILDLLHREGPIIIFNTNPESKPIENSILTLIRITPDEISDKKILNTFHELNHIVHESEDPETEIVSLTKEIEEVQLEHQKKLHEKLTIRQRPHTTFFVMGICTILTLAAYMFQLWMQNDVACLVAFGAFYKMNIIAAHEYWRLLTAGFLFQDPLILMIHMMALYTIGKACEHSYSRVKYVSIILLSIIVGNVFLLVSQDNSIALGMGAGVFGIFGALFAVLLAKGSLNFTIVKLSLLRLGISAAILMLLPGLSYQAYIGGFVTGLFLGILYSRFKVFAPLKKHIMSASIILLIGISYLGIKTTSIKPIDSEFDTSIVNIYRNTALNKYADYLQRCYNKQYRLE